MHGIHSDLVHACYRMLLSSMLYCMQNGCGRRLIGGGGSDFGGRCRFVVGQERRRMVWVGCGLPDHIDEAAQQEEGSAARWPRSKKKGRRRGGGAARRRVAGEEAELPVSRSEGLNLESKEQQLKCGSW